MVLVANDNFERSSFISSDLSISSFSCSTGSFTVGIFGSEFCTFSSSLIFASRSFFSLIFFCWSSWNSFNCCSKIVAWDWADSRSSVKFLIFCEEFSSSCFAASSSCSRSDILFSKSVVWAKLVGIADKFSKFNSVDPFWPLNSSSIFNLNSSSSATKTFSSRSDLISDANFGAISARISASKLCLRDGSRSNLSFDSISGLRRFVSSVLISSSEIPAGSSIFGPFSLSASFSHISEFSADKRWTVAWCRDIYEIAGTTMTQLFQKRNLNE